jgi:hypothetical protein
MSVASPEGAPVVTVRLDATGVDLEDPSAVAHQLPAPGALAAGTRVVVAAAATRKGGVLRRLLGSRGVPVSRAARCTALLVRGYVDVGADDDAAWGRVPS